jgi:predicted transcriptional regulator
MIKEVLEDYGHEVVLPNCYDNPNAEDEYRMIGEEEHANFKAAMYKKSEEVIRNVDGVLVINLNKNSQKNYIGGATFLEMYDAFRMQKDIYLYNQIPSGILTDEIIGFNPIIIDGDLCQIPRLNRVQSKIIKFMSDSTLNSIFAISRAINVDFDVCLREINVLCDRGLVASKDTVDLYYITGLGINMVEKEDVNFTKKLKR